MKTVTITPAMRASLYLHSLNDQNLRHIARGGVTVPNMVLYKKGNIAEAYARGETIRLSPSQVREIVSGMTETEKAFAQMARSYYNGQAKTETNETSAVLKGYEIARVTNYFPINTDRNFTRGDFEALKFDGTIEGIGSHKERIVAANPIYLRDVNTVLEQSIRMDGKYVGLAIPVRNFNKVWNVSTNTVDEESGKTTYYTASVQQAVRKQWGETGYKYVEKMMADLQNGYQEKNAWTQALNRVRSNYAGAVLTLNLSVAMKQAASYPTAAAVLGWRPLISAFRDVGKVDLDLIAQYTPLQWYRSQGFSTKELGDLKKADRQLPKVLNWVQGVDLLTTRKLWKASEYYVRQNNKSLKQNSDAYYRAVADIYNRVIEETQPNYTTMQRPQLLRSDDSLLGSLQMFKTQPFQNFNILYDAAENLQAKMKQGDKAAIKEARKNFSRAVTSQIGQLAVFAGMTFLWALMRGKTDKYEDDDGEMTLESMLSAIGKDMVGGLASGVPFGSDAWEFASAKLFGDRYYGMDAVTVTAISDTVQSVSKMGDLIGQTVEKLANGQAVNWNDLRIQTSKQMNNISKALGIPYENVVNLFSAFSRQTLHTALGESEGEFYNLLLNKDPKTEAGEYNNLLWKALESGDDEAYDSISNTMLKNGMTTYEDLRQAMKDRFKKAWEKDPDLEQDADLMKRAGVTERMIAGWKEADFKRRWEADPSIAEDRQAMLDAGVTEDTIEGWKESQWKASGYIEDMRALGADLDKVEQAVREIKNAEDTEAQYQALDNADLTDRQKLVLMKTFAGDTLRETMDTLDQMGADRQASYEVLRQLATGKTAEMKKEAIRKSALQDDQKLAVYKSLLSKDSGDYKIINQFELKNKADSGAVDMGEVYRTLDAINQAASTSEGRSVLWNSKLDDKGVEVILTKKLLTPEKSNDTWGGAIPTYDYEEQDKYYDVRDAGISVRDYLNIANQHQRIKDDDRYENNTARTTDFAHWLHQKGLTQEQEDLVRDKFKFWSMVPGEAGTYDEFTAAGIDENTAYSIMGVLNGLEPLEEGKSVSSKQKQGAVAFGEYEPEDKMKALAVLMQEEQYAKLDAAVNAGLPVDAYMDFALGISGMTSDKDENGNTISNSLQSKVMTYIDDIEGLTSEQKDYLFRTKYTSDKNLGNAPWHGGQRYEGELPEHGKVSPSAQTGNSSSQATTPTATPPASYGGQKTSGSGTRSSGGSSRSSGRSTTRGTSNAGASARIPLMAGTTSSGRRDWGSLKVPTLGTGLVARRAPDFVKITTPKVYAGTAFQSRALNGTKKTKFKKA